MLAMIYTYIYLCVVFMTVVPNNYLNAFLLK